MIDDAQPRARTRMDRVYALGWATLLCLSCMAYSTTLRADESTAVVSTAVVSTRPELTSRSGQDERDDKPAAPSGGAGVVNINTANAAELERLPRIGPARAQSILALRAKLKQFARVEQLLQVKGIGRATFRKLRPLLTLSGATTLEHERGGR